MLTRMVLTVVCDMKNSEEFILLCDHILMSSILAYLNTRHIILHNGAQNVMLQYFNA